LIRERDHRLRRYKIFKFRPFEEGLIDRLELGASPADNKEGKSRFGKRRGDPVSLDIYRLIRKSPTKKFLSV
jgi:hypothetical protein